MSMVIKSAGAVPLREQVAVIMPVYNVGNFITDAIRSVLWQSFPRWDLYVIDDGSNDSTGEIARRYAAADRRIHYLRQEKLGVSAARNYGIRESKKHLQRSRDKGGRGTSFIGFLDGDDIWEPHALETLIKLARRYPGCAAVNAWSTVIDEIGRPMPGWDGALTLLHRRKGVTRFNDFKSECFIYNPGQYLIRREALESINEADADPFHHRITCGEDWDVWLRLSQVAALVSEPVDVVRYRRRAGQVTANPDHCNTACEEIRQRYAKRPLNTIIDPLHRTEIVKRQLPSRPISVFTAATPGFLPFLDNFLGSFQERANLWHIAQIVLLKINDNGSLEKLAQRYRAEGLLDIQTLDVRALAPLQPWAKSVMYAAPHLTHSELCICLDCDCVVLDDLTPLLTALETLQDGQILAAENHSGNWQRAGETPHDLLDFIGKGWYDGSPQDFEMLFGQDPRRDAIASYGFIVNDGVYAGKRAALLQLDSAMREWMPGTNGAARLWLDQNYIRNQYLFNAALAKIGSHARLNPDYNVQLHMNDIDLSGEGKAVKATWKPTGIGGDAPRPVKIAHLTGPAKNSFDKLRTAFRLDR